MLFNEVQNQTSWDVLCPVGEVKLTYILPVIFSVFFVPDQGISSWLLGLEGSAPAEKRY